MEINEIVINDDTHQQIQKHRLEYNDYDDDEVNCRSRFMMQSQSIDGIIGVPGKKLNDDMQKSLDMTNLQ